MNDNTSLPANRENWRSSAQLVVQPSSYPPYQVDERASSPFGGVIAILRRRSRLIAVVFLTVSILGTLLTLAQTREYSATALLMINPNPDQIVPEKQSTSRADAGTVDSEIELMKSPALAARLASELNLSQDPEWNSALKKSEGLNLGVQLAKVMPPHSASDDITASIDDNALPPLPPQDAAASQIAAADDNVVDAVVQAINVRRRGLSYVVEVEASSQSPARAAEMANGLSNIYLKSLAEARFDASEKANLWLKVRLDELKAEVSQKQAAAQAYRARRNLLTAQGGSLVEQQIAVLQVSLLQTRAEYSQKLAESTQMTRISDRGETITAFNSPTDSMRDLRTREAEITQRLADLQSRYGPTHPSLVQALQEKAALDSNITAEMQRIVTRSDVETQSLAARARTQEAELASLRGELVSGNFDQVGLDALETDAEAAQSVYESFLQRYHEVARQGTLASVGARLLSPARAPKIPTSPHIMFNAAITAAAGLMLAFLAGLLAEQFRGTVETTEEVESRVGVRALVAIPLLRKRDLRNLPKRSRTPTAYLLTKRLSRFAETFRLLQTSIFLANQPHHNVVAITSAMPGEGKTTLSVGLARVAAMGGQRVIVVDCDVRMRSINRILGIEPTEGLQQVLAGEREWKDVVGHDEASGAHVLPASALTSQDIFSSGAMEKLVADLSNAYDLVILDCAPVFAVAETRVIASLADMVVVTARARKTPAKALAAAISQLEISGARVLGVALNGINAGSARRSFYDGLYYSKAFSGYYVRET